MSEYYTVSFFTDECSSEMEELYLISKIIKQIEKILSENRRVRFLLAYGNDFDDLIDGIILSVAHKFPETEFKISLIYKYSIDGFMNFLYTRPNGYNEYIIFDGYENNQLRHGNILRNKKMVDLSDVSYFYRKKRNGRVNSTMKYAKEHNKTIISLNYQ